MLRRAEVTSETSMAAHWLIRLCLRAHFIRSELETRAEVGTCRTLQADQVQLHLGILAPLLLAHNGSYWDSPANSDIADINVFFFVIIILRSF